MRENCPRNQDNIKTKYYFNILLEVPIRSNTDIGTIKRPIATNNWDVVTYMNKLENYLFFEMNKLENYLFFESIFGANLISYNLFALVS